MSGKNGRGTALSVVTMRSLVEVVEKARGENIRIRSITSVAPGKSRVVLTLGQTHAGDSTVVSFAQWLQTQGR